jgi:hypothetical protein
MNRSWMVCWVVAVAVVAVAGCTSGAREPAPPNGPYLGQSAPGAEPVLFAPGFVSTDLCERDLAISPSGDEMFYTIQGGASFRHWSSAIVTTRLGPRGWSDPAIALFSGRYNDLEPCLTDDGQRLYFSSNRPREGEDEVRSDFDIWYVDRVADGWDAPVNLGAPINSDHDEFYPSLTRDGTLYLTAAYDGTENIWRATPSGDGFAQPENLGPAVNDDGGAFNACIDRDERFLVFGRGRGLFVSFRGDDGTWSGAVELGEAINTGGLDYCPSLSPDGQYLFFTSTRPPRGLSATDAAGIRRVARRRTQLRAPADAAHPAFRL